MKHISKKIIVLVLVTLVGATLITCLDFALEPTEIVQPDGVNTPFGRYDKIITRSRIFHRVISETRVFTNY